MSYLVDLCFSVIAIWACHRTSYVVGPDRTGLLTGSGTFVWAETVGWGAEDRYVWAVPTVGEGGR